MGQTLSEPVTVKDTESVSNASYRVAASCMQGWRINMEDQHTLILSLKEDKDAAFFAVFDGHGGSKVAHYCGEFLHKKIVSQQGYSKGNYVDAMKSGFLSCDADMLQDETMKDEMAGSTAICILIKDSTMYSANCGDSRAVSSVRGKVQELSFDHKPSNEGETKRIIAAGGWVEFNRVNGNLALSRAMGDFIFKKNTKKSAEEQIVTAYPDVTVHKITDDHEFIFLACDGIWDVMSNEEVVDFVRCRIAKKNSPEQICEELLSHCLAPDCQMGGLGCDNMTVILVCLLNGGSYEDLAKKCARPADHPVVENGQKNTEEDESKMDLT
eukprot:Seg1698.2 transcript_id=Seg1698.2/GoldUCD/mRNA.D3Y31 product="putative protein phosphatase 2C T23F11.1" protein_id=Seg1698.2/GoldUCD/D3Y31